MAAPGRSPQPNRGHPAYPPGWATCAEEEQDTPGTRVPLGRVIWPLCHLKKQNHVLQRPQGLPGPRAAAGTLRFRKGAPVRLGRPGRQWV